MKPRRRQLQVVGELCAADGKAVVAAMSDTILYTVNPRRPQTDAYQLQAGFFFCGILQRTLFSDY